MFKGAHLTLLIGKVIARPAPKIVMDAVTDIQVTNSKQRSGFQISFSTGKTALLTEAMLPAGYFDPIVTRVIIVVTLNGFPNVLMDGLITNQEYGPSNDAGQSTFTITGEDLTLAMDLIELTVPYPGMPIIGIVNSIIARYVVLGIVPVVIPPFIPNFKNPTEGYDIQEGTDRAYIQELAERVGFVFFHQAGPLPGQSIAYFGPDVNLPIPQSALSVNFDAHSNVESMSFSLDGLAKKIKVFTIFDPVTKKIPIPIPVPNINAFKPPMGIRLTPPAKVSFSKDAAPMNPAEAGEAILGFMMKGSNSTSVTATGSLDVARYGKILRARMMVGVRGASLAYDGMYYVDSVTHSIKKGEYKQSFSLSRDGLISNTPLVRP
ncbi:MAG: hypothetical protein AAGF77_00120 [Bacteroidota bacterium]